VKRCSSLFFWFLDYLNKKNMKIEISIEDKIKNSIVLAIAFCYYCRIKTMDER
jgi:hypothetical protein